MYFIGIDSGTQSTKAVVLDLDSGKLVAEASEKYEMIEGLPAGHLEQDPQCWVDAVTNTIASCCEQLGASRDQIRGIGVSGQQHGLVVLDEDDAVIRPAKLWCDTSTTAQCDAYAEAFGGLSGLICEGGNAMLPGYTAPKILWIKENEPENFEKIRSILLPHDYLNFWLTGEKRMEYGDASGTGFFDVRKREWADELINFIDSRVKEWLPELGSSLVRHGALRPELASHWGLSGEVVVSAGGGDNMMGAIGTGNVTPGVITASFGTSGTLYGVAAQPVIDDQGEIAAFCSSTDLWMPLICTMNVTVVTEQVRQWFGWDLSELEKQVASANPGADGVHFLPFLNGERTPNLPDGSGVLHGMTASNAYPANLGRAAMEGATLGLAYGLRRFDALGLTPTEIRLTGGGSKSAVWRQLAADIFGVPVVGLATAEGAGLGAAIQAAHVVLAEGGNPTDYADLCAKTVQLDESTRCQPNPELTELYRKKLNHHVKLTETLRDGGLL